MKNINTVFLAEDLSIFKTLDGNRSVADGRVDKIVSSIQKVGFIQSPIVVNENLEVVDGQGRLEACKRLGLPIPFIKVKGIGIEECLSMNINQKNWTMTDYINSYAARGNENYQRIKVFYDCCGFSRNVAMWLLFRSGGVTESIKNGSAIVTEEMVDSATDLATFFHRFDGIEINRRVEFVIAVLYALQCDGVTPEHLIKSVQRDSTPFKSISDVADCIDKLDLVYNKGKRASRVFIRHGYEMLLAKRVPTKMREGHARWRQSVLDNTLYQKRLV